MSFLINYDKSEVRNKITLEQIFCLLDDWGGEPEYTDTGIISATICHNEPGHGSRKLYFYSNSNLFNCFSNCGSFDIFELTIKVFEIQFHKTIDLNEAVRWVAQKCGISGTFKEEEADQLEDWKILANYDRIQEITIRPNKVLLKEYEKNILNNFNYRVRLTPWLNEGINQETLQMAQIGYYPGGDQITIPHFDKDNRLVGLRGRTLGEEEAVAYGKYRPLYINQQLYNHPLGLNLYGLNWTQNNIATFGKAIVYESEKSVLLHQSYFPDSNMSVACCGSNLTAHQVQLLMESGAKEIIVAFDRQFQQIGDEEHIRLKNNYTKLKKKFKNYIDISFIIDLKKITGYKSSPIDEGPEKFLKLFKERVR